MFLDSLKLCKICISFRSRSDLVLDADHSLDFLGSQELSGMFRRSASLAIPHLKSFAAIPSVSRVHLGHTNRSVSLSHESQREIALVLALSRPIPYYQQGDVGEKNGPVLRKVMDIDVSRAVGIARFESVSEPQLNRAIQCH